MLDKLVEFSPNLTKFTLDYFNNPDNAQAITNMTEKILLRPNSKLTHLDLSSNFRYTTLESGKKLLEAISSSIEPTLLSLNLSGNNQWWSYVDFNSDDMEPKEKYFDQLLEVLEK